MATPGLKRKIKPQKIALMKFMKTFLAALLAVVVGSILTFFLWIFILVGVAGSMDKSVSVHPKSILKIDLSESITDSPSTDPFAGIDVFTLETTKQMSLMKALRAIEAAREDERIDGIYLRLNGGGSLSSAIVEELRQAIADFKESGKFVVSYNETYSHGQYYLASVADSVYLHPEGAMDWSGLSFNLMFFKGLLDKLDVKVEVFRPTACKYKSAVEPYIASKMSDANREQMQQLVKSMWKTIAGTIAESRDMDFATLDKMADKLDVALSEDALEKGLVDGLIYEDEMDGIFAELGATADAKGKYKFVSLADYAAQVVPDAKKLSAPQIAVVYADGQIVDGNGSGAEIYGNTLAKTLADVRANDKYKAVVVRVNSPGGSALASDVIWREMELLKAEKPVVVSMGSYAASGGYYISAPADVIVADKLTLTGSIGVYGVMFNTLDALKNKLGVTFDAAKSNTSAGAGISSPLTAAERAQIMRGTDKVYTRFTSLVSEGRNLPLEKVLDIAGGRVWSGDDALEIGLIDTYGGLTTAIALAADKAEIADSYRVTEVLEEPTGFAAIFSSLNVSINELFVSSELKSAMGEYRQIKEAMNNRGVVMYSPYKVELR